ncbi:unnamed protein product [Brachionus calyciflorus]|uniref:Uncharacterized protein n=1 Tax=Brachionus calyciflorus TaxID=104777 RepID=A0A813MDG6_9BILA|nr:unnamed protein product [Brachionus calyciflorus]
MKILVFLLLVFVSNEATKTSSNLREKLKASALTSINKNKDNKLKSSSEKLKLNNLKGDYGYGGYYDHGYEYDYGHYIDSYRCKPYDYYCLNFGYDYGGYFRKRR